MIWEILTPYVARMGATEFALWIGQSTARVYTLFTFHLFGLVLLIGGMIFVSLRLLGLLVPHKPAPEVGRMVLPVIGVGLALMLLSGFFIFLGGAEAYLEGQWFRLKMILLLCAIIYHFAFFRRVALAPEGQFNSLVSKGAAVVALLLWFGVGWAGRAIAFF